MTETKEYSGAFFKIQDELSKPSRNHYFLNELTFEITKKCPMKCILCSSNGGTRCSREFSLNEIKKIIEDSISLGTIHINISGGEPFSHPHLFDICKYIKEKGISVDIYSCGNIEKEDGTLKPLENKTLVNLKKIGIDKIIFSIHGDNESIHDYITTKKGSFSNLIESVKRANFNKMYVEMHFVPTKLNYKSLPKVICLTKKLNVKKLSILRFVPQGRGWINKELLELKSKDIIEIKNILWTVEKNTKGEKLRVGSPFNCFHLDNQTICSAGIDKATIKADGLVFPCVSMKDFITDEPDNSIWNRPLSNIWNDSKLFNLARASKRIIEEESSCKKCLYFNKCGGGCLTQRLISNRLEDKDPYCLISVADYLEKIVWN